MINSKWLTIIICLVMIAACKKETPCTDITAYAQNTYILRDSIVYLHDSISIIADTVVFRVVPNSGGEVFINYLMPDKVFLVVKGCANSFAIDTGSFGSGYTYFGKGNFSGNGNNISLTVTRVPWQDRPSDTVQYYCSGIKQ